MARVHTNGYAKKSIFQVTVTEVLSLTKRSARYSKLSPQKYGEISI